MTEPYIVLIGCIQRLRVTYSRDLYTIKERLQGILLDIHQNTAPDFAQGAFFLPTCQRYRLDRLLDHQEIDV